MEHEREIKQKKIHFLSRLLGGFVTLLRFLGGADEDDDGDDEESEVDDETDEEEVPQSWTSASAAFADAGRSSVASY